jgi:hypothetical protein
MCRDVVGCRYANITMSRCNAELSARSDAWDEVNHTMLHCNASNAYFMLLILFHSSTTSSLRTEGYQSNWQLP